jgi:hypothetical protein
VQPVELPGSGGRLAFCHDESGLTVTFPARTAVGHAHVFKLNGVFEAAVTSTSGDHCPVHV